MNTAVPRLAADPRTGLVDDGAWSTVAPLGELVDARTGGVPRDRTVVRIAASPRALHVRFDCDDRDVWGTHVLHDAPLWEEEAVEVFLASGAEDPARYAEFEISPAGTLFDALVTNPDGRRETMAVDTGWAAVGLVGRVSRPDVARWCAELSIAWGSLPRSWEEGGVWRANFFRIERPRGSSPEHSAWSPTYADPPDFHKPSRFGRLWIG